MDALKKKRDDGNAALEKVREHQQWNLVHLFTKETQIRLGIFLFFFVTSGFPSFARFKKGLLWNA